MAATSLLVADAVSVLGQLFTPQWGVFIGGSPVIQPATAAGQAVVASIQPLQAVASLLGATNIVPITASTLTFEYSNDQPISDYPQEEGAFQSYNKVANPFDVKVRVACSGGVARRQAFIQTILAILDSRELFDVVTPELVFPSCNCIHVDWRRTADSGVSLLAPDLWFRQVKVKNATTFSSTATPGGASATGLGTVQAQPAPGSVQGYVSTGGGFH